MENVVSKMDFNVTKRNSAKIWISNDQDLKVACETLGKLTLWCIEMEKLKAQKRDGIVTNPSQMIRVSALQGKSDVKNEVHVSKTNLQQYHGFDYSAVKYTLWVE